MTGALSNDLNARIMAWIIADGPSRVTPTDLSVMKQIIAIGEKASTDLAHLKRILAECRVSGIKPGAHPAFFEYLAAVDAHLEHQEELAWQLLAAGIPAPFPLDEQAKPLSIVE